MAVIRVEKNRNFTTMSNYHLRDKELSLKAKGLLSQILSLPDEWDYSVRGLASICLEGKDCIVATLKELEIKGYLVRKQLRDANGRLGGIEYQGDDYKVAKRDWHYRIHALTVNVDEKDVIENAVIDFKHYFTVPMTYLIAHKKDRILHLDDLFAEQVTLKFSTYLARVAIP